jgi:predicted ArsR family transcriptional regulator
MNKMVKSQKYQILSEIKRSQGLSVQELCDRVNLSYMGVKQHCIALEREGYVDTWRRPKGMGRPEKAYRLTELAQEYFPNEFTKLTSKILDSVGEVYGPSAPEKILYHIYNEQTLHLQQYVFGTSLEERARNLAGLRDEDGYMSEYQYDTAVRRHQIVEYHSPIMQVMDRYPIIRDLEVQMFEKILNVKVNRKEERISGLYKCTFVLES